MFTSGLPGERSGSFPLTASNFRLVRGTYNVTLWADRQERNPCQVRCATPSIVPRPR